MVNSCLDADMNLRIVDAGYNLVMRKDIIVKHFWKPTLRGFLKRQWAYAFYRPKLKGDLYSSDKVIKFEIFILSVLFASLFVALFYAPSIYITLYSFILFLIVQSRITFTMTRLKKDAWFLLFPLMALMRDTTALIAFSFGKIKFFGR